MLSDTHRKSLGPLSQKTIGNQLAFLQVPHARSFHDPQLPCRWPDSQGSNKRKRVFPFAIELILKFHKDWKSARTEWWYNVPSLPTICTFTLPCEMESVWSFFEINLDTQIYGPGPLTGSWTEEGGFPS